jgi:hypothetical protein
MILMHREIDVDSQMSLPKSGESQPDNLWEIRNIIGMKKVDGR